jgi:hypothetical protein
MTLMSIGLVVAQSPTTPVTQRSKTHIDRAEVSTADMLKDGNMFATMYMESLNRNIDTLRDTLDLYQGNLKATAAQSP